MIIKNVNNVAEATNNIVPGEPKTYVELYYSFSTQKVTTEKTGDGCYHITTLIRRNTSEDIRDAVRRFLTM